MGTDGDEEQQNKASTSKNVSPRDVYSQTRLPNGKTIGETSFITEPKKPVENKIVEEEVNGIKIERHKFSYDDVPASAHKDLITEEKR